MLLYPVVTVPNVSSLPIKDKGWDMGYSGIKWSGGFISLVLETQRVQSWEGDKVVYIGTENRHLFGARAVGAKSPPPHSRAVSPVKQAPHTW